MNKTKHTMTKHEETAREVFKKIMMSQNRMESDEISITLIAAALAQAEARGIEQINAALEEAESSIKNAVNEALHEIRWLKAQVR